MARRLESVIVVSRGTQLVALAAIVLAAFGASVLHAASGTPIKVVHGTQLTDEPWVVLAHARSPRTRVAAFVRGFRAAPTGLAFTVTATHAERINVFWSVYCEGQANDEISTPQGSFKLRTPFSAYPPVMPSATKCFLTVRATPTRTGKAIVVAYGY